jgi:cytoskeletal protein RodZ
MKKTILTLCIGAACLLAPSAFAQTTAQDQTNASPAKPATQAEKDAARKARQAAGKKATAAGQESDKPESSGKVTGTTSAERKKTNAARRAKNANVAKEPKVDKSPN